MNNSRPSNLAVYATLIALALVALAGVVIVSPGNESTQRLALLFGVLGTGIASIAGLIKSDQAATRLNGNLDDRMQNANLRANSARRASDIVPDSASGVPSPNGDSPVENG